MARTAKTSPKRENAATVAAHREKLRAEIWSKIPGGRPAELDEPDTPKKPRPRSRSGYTTKIFFAHKEPGIKVNTTSAVYRDGYESMQGGGWWRGCPHCHDTQEFADWQAGWHKAYYESRA